MSKLGISLLIVCIIAVISVVMTLSRGCDRWEYADLSVHTNVLGSESETGNFIVEKVDHLVFFRTDKHIYSWYNDQPINDEELLPLTQFFRVEQIRSIPLINSLSTKGWEVVDFNFERSHDHEESRSWILKRCRA